MGSSASKEGSVNTALSFLIEKSSIDNFPKLAEMKLREVSLKPNLSNW